MEENQVTIISSLVYANTYYLFRPNGQEVVVTYKNKTLKSSAKLSQEELNFINDNIL